MLGGVVVRLGVLQHEDHLLWALRLCDLGLRRGLHDKLLSVVLSAAVRRLLI